MKNAKRRIVHGVDLTGAERQMVVDFLGEALGNDFNFTDLHIFEFIDGRCVGSIEDEEMIKIAEIEDYVLESEDEQHGVLTDGVVFGKMGLASLG